VDESLLLAINGLRSPALDPVGGFLSDWGLFGFLVALLVVGLRKRAPRDLETMRDGWLAFFVSSFFADTVIKPFVGRPRPTAVEALASHLHVLGRAPPATSTSFPSGTAAACAGAAAWIWIRLGPRWGIPAVIYAVLVSLSRVYVGVHWPSDLLGGAVVGVAVAAGIDRLGRRIARP
jgi:undecaprenyl-diphosphatase